MLEALRNRKFAFQSYKTSIIKEGPSFIPTSCIDNEERRHDGGFSVLETQIGHQQRAFVNATFILGGFTFQERRAPVSHLWFPV